MYCTAEHDSLKISNGKWYWWSRGFGGYSALDYLIKVKEYDFVEAVEILTGQTMADWKPPPTPKKDEPKVLLLPPKNKDCNRVIQYLFGRGIDYQLIQDCVADGTIFESAEYHNAVFVGKDEIYGDNVYRQGDRRKRKQDRQERKLYRVYSDASAR